MIVFIYFWGLAWLRENDVREANKANTSGCAQCGKGHVQNDGDQRCTWQIFPPAYGEATHHCPSVAAACAEESQDASGSYKDGGC